VEALGELGYREAELEKLLADEVALQCAEAYIDFPARGTRTARRMLFV
jgi:hypothetical protein